MESFRLCVVICLKISGARVCTLPHSLPRVRASTCAGTHTHEFAHGWEDFIMMAQKMEILTSYAALAAFRFKEAHIRYAIYCCFH